MGWLIAADKNQFAGSHGRSNYKKHKQIELITGNEVMPVPLPFGDYCLVTNGFMRTVNRRGMSLKKMDLVGDIKVSVDTKKGLQEVAMNICSGSHDRFRDEVILAQKCGCKLYVLVEEYGIRSVADVFRWHNPRLDIMVPDKSKVVAHTASGKRIFGKKRKYPRATTGETLGKAMKTMQEKYGCEFVFCEPDEAGKVILDLLSRRAADGRGQMD